MSYPTKLVPFNKFKVSCEDTVPVAIKIFVESKDMEDILRTAVSLGGDCDTIASMACELQVAFDMGLDEKYVKFVESNLDDFQLSVLKDFNRKY